MTSEITYPNQLLTVNNTPSLDTSTHSATGLSNVNPDFTTTLSQSSVHMQLTGTTAYADMQVVNEGAGAGHGVMVVTDNDNYAVEVRPLAINFRDSVGAIQNSLISNATYLATTGLQPSAILDGFLSAGNANQILSAGASGGSLLWADPAVITTPNLASVLAVATAGDAGNQPISNLTSLALADTTTVLSSNSLSMGATPLVISADASGFLALNTVEVPKFATTLNSYVPVSINGTVYYMQLYSAT